MGIQQLPVRALAVALALPAIAAVASLAAADGQQTSARAARQDTSLSVDADKADPDGTTPLHKAVRAGDAARVQQLIRGKANVNAANRYGVTSLHLAAENGDRAILEMLLKAGANPNASLGAGQTVLMTAARQGNPDALRVLIARGANVNAKEQYMGETALMWAAAENHPEAVKVLAESGANLNVRSAATVFPAQKFTTSGMVSTYLNRGEWTALMYAARQDAKEGVKALIAAGADLDARDPDGTNALSFAILNAHYDLAAILIEGGANPDVVDESGIGALYQAVDMHTLGNMFSRPMPQTADKKYGPVEIVKLLLDHGANPNLQNLKPGLPRHHGGSDQANGEGTTPLMRATASGDLPIVQVLLDHKANVKVTKPDGSNVLMLALGGGGGRGANNANGMGGFGGGAGGAVTDPFVVAAARLFIEHGVEVNAANGTGQTALHLAAGRGQDQVVRMLAEAGARLDAKDTQGLMPIQFAMGLGGAGGRGGRGAAGRGAAPAAPVVRDTTVALLRDLMTAKGLSIPVQPAAPPAPAAQ